MENIRKIREDLYYVGCSDRRLRLFESAYAVPKGASYNSYIIKDTKTVLIDSVDKVCCHQFFENIKAVLNDRKLDYFIVQHMEPDHSALIEDVVSEYPDVKILCSAKAQTMLKQFFNFDIEKNTQIVNEGDVISTGNHELTFYNATMVHWPEVIVTYDKTTGDLFTADAFGSFGAIDGILYDDYTEWNDYIKEARRYYTNIVGKYGPQVQMLLKKATTLEIKAIYPLHGLIIRKNIGQFIECYDKWSKYEPEKRGVLIAFSSVYGNTENVVDILASKLADSGVKNIEMFDTSLYDHSEILAKAFEYSHIVIATTTYNNDIFESMQNFIHELIVHNLQNRKYIIIENGTWVPSCGNKVREELEKLKGSEFLTDNFMIKSSVKKEQIADLDNVVITIEKSLKS